MKQVFFVWMCIISISCYPKSTTEQGNIVTSEPLTSTLTPVSKSPSKVYIQNGNVHLVYTDGTTKKLTFLGLDEQALLMKQSNQVVVIRKNPNTTPTYREIMLVDIKTPEETVIADRKPYRDGLNGLYKIVSVGGAMLSEDERYLYFTTEKYATGNALIELDLKSKNWREISPANSFKRIDTPKYPNHFAVRRNEIRNSGRTNYWMLIDNQGEKVRDFANYQDLEDFLVTGKGGTAASLGKMYIKKIILKSFPSRKSNGERWDNSMGGVFPDIYIEQRHSNGSIISNPDRRIENISSDDLPIELSVYAILYTADESFTFVIKDYDSITDDDVIYAFSIDMKGYTRKDVSDSIKDNGVELDIVWEWQD